MSFGFWLWTSGKIELSYTKIVKTGGKERFESAVCFGHMLSLIYLLDIQVGNTE